MDGQQYSFEYTLTVDDVDRNQNVKPSAVFRLFQQAATEHSDICGCGYKEMKEVDCSWVLMRQKCEIDAPLSYGQRVTVKTWPLKKGLCDFDRDFVVLQEDGSVAVRGSSKWCVIDNAKRKIVRGEQVRYPDECLSERALDAPLGKLLEANGVCAFTHTVRLSDIDRNGHMNNVRYVDLIYDALTEEEAFSGVKKLQVNYLHERMLADTLCVKREDKSGKILISAYGDGKCCFSSELTL